MEQNSFNSGGRFIFTLQFHNQVTILKYLYFNYTKDTPVIYKLQSHRAVKSFTILLNDIFKQLGDAKLPPANARAKTHCGKHTGHTAHMAKGDIIQ